MAIYQGILKEINYTFSSSLFCSRLFISSVKSFKVIVCSTSSACLVDAMSLKLYAFSVKYMHSHSTSSGMDFNNFSILCISISLIFTVSPTLCT